MADYVPRALVLPSARSAADLIDGDIKAVPGVIWCTAFRSFLVLSGMYTAGLRGKNLLLAAASGALAVEAFVLGYSVYDKIKTPGAM